MRKIVIYILFFFNGIVLLGQNNLSLREAIVKTLENNYQIQLIQLNNQISQTQNTWGQAGMSPTFSFNLNNNNVVSDNTNNPATFFPGVILNDNLQGTVDMTWAVFNGFGVRINKQRLEQLQEQTEGNGLIVIENTIYEIIIAYYTSVVQKRKLEIVEEMFIYTKEKQKYFSLKSDMGLSTSFDVLEFESQVLNDSTNLLIQKLAYKNSLRNINLLMGESIEVEYTLTDKIEFKVPNTSFGELSQKMLANNQNIKNQYIQLELQELNYESQKTAYYPVISLSVGATPSIGYIRLFGDNGFSINTSSVNYYANVSARYTIFNGYNRKRDVEIAKIQKNISEIQLQDLELKLQHQLRNIFETYQSQSQIEEMSAKRIEITKKLWDLAKDRYDSGLINVFNLNDVKSAYQQSVLNYYDRLFDLLKTHYDLIKISGTLSQEISI